MSKYLISDTILQDTADSLRAKLETQAKIKPSEFASKIDDIVTNTGAFQVETVEEMNALTKMKVGDYCVVKGVPTYVIPETDTIFTRFTGNPEDIMNDTYKDYMFMILSYCWSAGSSSKYRALTSNYAKDGSYNIVTLATIGGSLPSTLTRVPLNSNQVFQFIKTDQGLKIKFMDGKYLCNGGTYGVSTSMSDDNYLPIIDITKTSGTNDYRLKVSDTQCLDDVGSWPWVRKGSIYSSGNTDSNLRFLFYAKLQSTTVDHLVYEYRENSGWVDVTDDILVPQTNITPTTSSQTPRIPDGYRGFKNITVNAIQTETKTTTPTAVQQVITPASGKYLSQVTVNATPLETITITATTEQQTITPTQGNVGISQITVNPVASSIDPNIVAENIKKGVTILGITGTYEGIVPEDEYDYQLNTAKEIAGIEGGDN